MRVVNRILSAILALALLVGGVLVVLEIASAALGREKPLVLPWDEWYDSARDTPWRDPDLRLLFVALVAIGAVVLLVQLVRRRPTAIPMAPTSDGADARLDRSGLERWLKTRVQGVDGVSSARVRVRRRKARVNAVTSASETVALRSSVEKAAYDALQSLGLSATPRVQASVASRRQA